MKAARQVGALCVCKADDDQLQVLLVTSRDTRRWIIPKGWPIKGLEPYEAAAREALEEGGVYGKTGARAVGRYRYYRKSKKGARVHVVSVYLIAVSRALDRWEEEAERKRAWFSVSSAARRVAEPELRSIIRRVESVRDHPEWQSVGQLRGPNNADPGG
jgi:8-oxo-dGTP pyrophosphatase MutT (NUDIX family)